MKRRAITGLGRLGIHPPTAVALTIFFTGCSGAVSSGTVRRQVAELGGANLNSEDIQVQRIVDQLGGRTVAEANVRLAFQFEEGPDGEMHIVAVRLGTGQWLDVAELLAAIESGNVSRTTDDIARLATGLRAYRDENGTLPESTGNPISDVLHPQFMTELVRNDAWGRAITYDRTGPGFELRSMGPDGLAETSDDIVITDLPTP